MAATALRLALRLFELLQLRAQAFELSACLGQLLGELGVRVLGAAAQAAFTHRGARGFEALLLLARGALGVALADRARRVAFGGCAFANGASLGALPIGLAPG